MSKVCKMLIVDDHPVVIEALKKLVNQIDGVEIVGFAANGQECLREVEKHQPDLILLDYNLPDQVGSNVARTILKKYPQTNIMIITGTDVMPFYNELLNIGVVGIIQKNYNETTVRNMIHAILDNHTMIPISIYKHMRLMAQHQSDPGLTEEEITIMSMVVKGSTQEQIADQIHVSKRSIDNYLKRIYEKLEVKHRLQAIERFMGTHYYSDGGERK